jgi:catechol 2,3-dioxygenase-like lactoylglutathione lyase family enzyme
VYSRRTFLGTASGALVASLVARGETKSMPYPTNLDHIILGTSDLQQGIAFVEARLGVRAAIGGVHPGRGTQNALLSLGERHYLEIMAPDPAQPDSKNPLVAFLKKLGEPRLVEWAAHCDDLAALAKKLREAGVAFEGPTPGSRKRPDGRVLHWQTLVLKANASWLLPFFIEWSADSVHPSVDAPQGCCIVRLEAATSHPEELAKTAALLSLDLPITKGDKPQLHATFGGPKGTLEANSETSPA